MSDRHDHPTRRPSLTPALLIKAYSMGVFPMADAADDPDVFWVEPKRRGLLPLDIVHCPKRLARTIRQDKVRVTTDACFEPVMRACAAERPIRPSTWINQEIIDGYCALHKVGHAHSVEVWSLDDELIGGLYGVSIGAAFFGESMFSTQTDASKIALMHLIARLKIGHYQLLDTQFFTDHLGQFGAVEMPQDAYLDQLAPVLAASASFTAAPSSLDGATVLQSITQTS